MAVLLVNRIPQPAFTSLISLVFIFKLQIYEKLSNMVSGVVTHVSQYITLVSQIVNILQRCGLLSLPDTRTPSLLNATYEQIINKTITNHKFIWWRNLPSEPNQDQAPIYRTVCTASSHLELQYREQELVNALAQHKREQEQEKQLRIRTQQINVSFDDTQKPLRRQLDVSRTCEVTLKADLLAAERERKKLKDRAATPEASDAALRAEITATVDETREAAMMLGQQSGLAAEKDHVLRSTNKDLLAVRARLQDSEDKITRLDAELRIERKLQIHRTKELNEEAKARRLCEAQMRRISNKTEHVQVLLDLIDDLFPPSHARMMSPQDAHIHYLTSYAIAVAPDDTGQSPPSRGHTISDVRTLLLNFNTKPRPISPKSLRQTPERIPHDSYDSPLTHPPTQDTHAGCPPGLQ